MKNKLYRVVCACMLFSIALIANSQDVPVELADGGSIDYHQRRGSIQELHNQNLVSQDAILRMTEFGMGLNMQVDLSYARLGTVISEQIKTGVGSFDPAYPEHGDTRSVIGKREEGDLTYEYVVVDMYLLTSSGGGWHEQKRIKKLTEIPPPSEDDVNDGGN